MLHQVLCCDRLALLKARSRPALQRPCARLPAAHGRPVKLVKELAAKRCSRFLGNLCPGLAGKEMLII